MAAKKSKGLNINIDKDEVMYTNISKSKDGYNSARVVVKRGDKEYMSISYEWEGDGVPGFAMDLMGFMKANALDPNTVIDEKAYAEYEEHAAMPPWIKDKKDKKESKDKDKKGKDKKVKDKKDKKGKKKKKEDSDLEDE